MNRPPDATGDTPLPHPVTGDPFGSPVQPGTGWPHDPASPGTPAAGTPADAAALAADVSLAELAARVSVCRACPRLVAWREDVAVSRRAAFVDQPYWGRPVPGWGVASPRVLLLGLAPAAHGGNRTGRLFTGDRSGDWLFAALHRAGLARQPGSEHAGDAQELVDARMVAAVRCAPPANRPTTAERDTCAPWLHRELELVLPVTRAVVCLGSFAWEAALRGSRALGYQVPRPKPHFGHGVEVRLPSADQPPVVLLGCYHPSQQNTFTGRLTEPMLDAVLARARTLADSSP